MLPQNLNIQELIPQRPPMVMIDKLLSFDATSATARLQVTESNLFVHHNQLQEAGMVECTAQTAAAYMGFRNTTEQKPVTEGYIGAIKNLVIHALPSVGDVLHAQVVVENEIVGYTIVKGILKNKQQNIASCELRILTASE